MELTLTQSSIDSIERLDLSNLQITDISGIEVFEKLLSLNLSNNSINDFSPISKTKKVDELYLNNCGITDLSFLNQSSFNSKELFVLDLSNNQLLNFNTLDAFTNIRKLYLANTRLTDSNIIQLKDLKVNDLDISNNVELTDISILNYLIDLTNQSDLGLKKGLINLSLAYNKKIDLTTIPDHIEELNLSNMELKNDDLKKLNYQYLQSLNLAYNNQITSLENISNKTCH